MKSQHCFFFFLMVGDTKLARNGVCVTLKNTKRWFLDMNRKRWCLEPYKEPSCPILCDPRDGSPPGSPVPGILQARTLEWVAISFSNAWKWKVKVKSLSHVWLLATPWTADYQAPPSMGFARQEYWNGVPLPSPSWTIPDNKQVCKYLF